MFHNNQKSNSDCKNDDLLYILCTCIPLLRLMIPHVSDSKLRCTLQTPQRTQLDSMEIHLDMKALTQYIDLNGIKNINTFTDSNKIEFLIINML